MKYTDSSIDKVREADIVKTISSVVELKREGANYKGLSPFTKEKTPSFVVSPSKQIWKCFSTGVGGDGIKFIMLNNGMEFLDAVEHIAQIHTIHLEKEEVSPDQKRKISQKAEMYRITDLVNRSFTAAFKKLPDDHWAIKLINDREINLGSTIDFSIGYNGNENKLTKWAAEEGSLGVAKDLGLSDTKNGTSYDKFRDRIMFPIHNEKGNIVGFGGRKSDAEDVQKFPKYLNSKESLIYNKSTVLYGLWQAKRSINKIGSAILVEGYTDVISMHQNGCDNTIATCGTALTVDQAKLIKKYCNEVVLLRDGDKAGLNAMLKKDGDIDRCLAAGLDVKVCLLPEGEDPDSFCRQENDMLEWVDVNKIDALHWKVDQYDFTPDRYAQNVEDIKQASEDHIDELKSQLVKVASLKGDELEEAREKNKQLRKEIEDTKKQRQSEIKELPTIDANKKSNAVSEIAATLFLIRHEVKRGEYIKQVAKSIQISIHNLKNEIAKYEQWETEEREREEKRSGKPSMRGVVLPPGASKDEYLEGHGFVTVGNSYYFQVKEGFIQGTTFVMQPLFHIQGDKENKRLCEITNIQGKKRLIDFDTELLVNFTEFRKNLFRIGGYMFMTHNGVRTEHFDKFVYRYEEQFEPALELLTMGWNKKGFYAFANGVQWEGKFREVNKYGIMHLEGIDSTESEYKQAIDYYYSPAFSVMHQDKQDGDDIYENDRYFVYKQASIGLKDWMGQMIKVFGDKGIMGIVFNFASIFRDLFLSNYDFFPLLGGFGEKDSGKSGFGKILQNFFYYRLPPLDLTQATHVGFSRRLSRNTNTVQFCDEYQDRNCREDVFNAMMGSWNGIGREKGNGVGTNRTSYDKINSAIYYAGQFMPTRMENALATRTLALYFQTRQFSSQEKADYNKLLNWTNQGISSLVTEIVEHRSYFEKQLPIVHAETERELREDLDGEQYQPRIFGNASMILTTFRILKDKIKFPFDDKTIASMIKELIIDNSEQIADSNGLSDFWNIIGFLFEAKVISVERDFVIDQSVSFKIVGEKRSLTVHHNDTQSRILFLRLKSVYQHYNKEVTKREGVDVIGQTTLRHYFKSRPYFIGLVKSKYFKELGGQPPSCYAFNYDMMVAKGLVNLQIDPPSEGEDGDKDDLPF